MRSSIQRNSSGMSVSFARRFQKSTKMFLRDTAAVPAIRWPIFRLPAMCIPACSFPCLAATCARNPSATFGLQSPCAVVSQSHPFRFIGSGKPACTPTVAAFDASLQFSDLCRRISEFGGLYQLKKLLDHCPAHAGQWIINHGAAAAPIVVFCKDEFETDTVVPPANDLCIHCN